MKTRDLTELAFRNLREAILRNSLTTLGVAVGVASLVAMLSLGVGLQTLASQRLNKSGLFDAVFVTSKRGMRGMNGEGRRPAATKTAKPEDELFEIAIEAGADDLREDGDNFEIITSPENFEGVQSAIKSAGIEPQMAEVSMVPQTYVKLEVSSAQQMLRLMETIEDHDDVQKVYANFDIDDADMAAA